MGRNTARLTFARAPSNSSPSAAAKYCAAAPLTPPACAAVGARTCARTRNHAHPLPYPTRVIPSPITRPPGRRPHGHRHGRGVALRPLLQGRARQPPAALGARRAEHGQLGAQQQRCGARAGRGPDSAAPPVPRAGRRRRGAGRIFAAPGGSSQARALYYAQTQSESHSTHLCTHAPLPPYPQAPSFSSCTSLRRTSTTSIACLAAWWAAWTSSASWRRCGFGGWGLGDWG